MAESFNLNTFKQEFSTYNKQYKTEDVAKQAMEDADIARAEAAVGNEGFLNLTLGSKLGIGERVVNEIGKTAANVALDVVRPLAKYLEEYEEILDQNLFTEKFQALAKEYYFSKEALSNYASSGFKGLNGLSEVDKSGNIAKTGTKFIWDM